jgi:lysophospholipase L1-like esterase
MATATATQPIEEKSVTKPKWRPRLAKFLLFVVTLMAAEGILAYLDHRNIHTHTHVLSWGQRRAIDLKEPSPGREIQWVPSGEFLDQSDGYLEKREYHYKTDEHGFLTPSILHTTPDITLIFQGGSTTEIVFVDPELRFPYLVGRILEQKTRKTVNSLNHGVSGAYTLDSINALENKLVAYHPTFVVMMEDINDLNTLIYNNSSYYGDVRNSIEEIEQKPLRRKRSVFRSSVGLLDAVCGTVVPHLYSRVLALGGSLLGMHDQTDEFASVRNQDHYIDPQAIKDNFRRNLTLYVRTARIYGTTPVLMTQANRFYDDSPEWQSYIKKNIEAKTRVPFEVYRELHRSLNEVTREVGRAENVLVIDLEKRIPAKSEFIHDPVHFNNNGSQLAARIIADELVARYFPASLSK